MPPKSGKRSRAPSDAPMETLMQDIANHPNTEEETDLRADEIGEGEEKESEHQEAKDDRKRTAETAGMDDSDRSKKKQVLQIDQLNASATGSDSLAFRMGAVDITSIFEHPEWIKLTRTVQETNIAVHKIIGITTRTADSLMYVEGGSRSMALDPGFSTSSKKKGSAFTF